MKQVRILTAFLLLCSVLSGTIFSTYVDASPFEVKIEAREGSDQKPPCYIKGENRCRKEGFTPYQLSHEVIPFLSDLAPFLPASIQVLAIGNRSFHRSCLSKEIFKPPEGHPSPL